MQLAKQLLKTEAAGLLALVAAAAMTAAHAAYEASVQSGFFPPAGAASVLFLGTLILGFLPVAVFGAPVYVWLQRRRRATWANVLAVGVVPGIVLFFVDYQWGVLGL